jgi:hypothetical protein
LSTGEAGLLNTVRKEVGKDATARRFSAADAFSMSFFEVFLGPLTLFSVLRSAEHLMQRLL